jgi:probable addiction module antidote protein
MPIRTDDIETPEEIAAYLTKPFAGGNTFSIVSALRIVARAHGMEELAESLRMSRSGLYKALGSEGNPSFATVLQLLNSLGLELSVHPQQTAQRHSPPKRARKK